MRNKYKIELYTAGVLFFLSGSCGLIYEIVWVKLLGLHFGNSSWSISTVIAAFMAGLGLGSWWCGKIVHKIQRPFRAYAYLEFVIALFGVISIGIFQYLNVIIEPLYHAFSENFTIFIVIRFFISFIILLIPTVLMGATLPILVVGISKKQEFQKTISLLYGINTIGAAFGVMGAGFMLIPLWGLKQTIFIAAILGTVVGLISFIWDLKREEEKESEIIQEEKKIEDKGKNKVPYLLLIALLLSGSVGISYEISWTKLLAPILGSSTYAFSIILSTYLIGIGIGSLFSGTSLAPKKQYYFFLGILLITSSIFVLGGLFFINKLPLLFFRLAQVFGSKISYIFLSQAFIAGSIILIPTCIMGAIVPLAITGYQKEHKNSGKAIGNIYAANTMGAILGSAFTGFFVVPFYGVQKSILIFTSIGTITAILLILSEKKILLKQKFITIALGFTVILFLHQQKPEIDFSKLQVGVFRGISSNKKRRLEHSILFAKDGISSMVTVHRNANATYLKINGKADASTHYIDLETQYMLAHYPLFLKKNVKKVCVIGWGSGATVRAVASHKVESIDVIELEPAVIETSKYFRTINNNVQNDPRVKIYIRDGRNFIQYTKKKYDVIISEPSNPWIVGIGNLFTSEFYQMIKKRLSKKGLLCQWIQAYYLTKNTFNAMIRTLGDNFSHVILFSKNSDILCIASDSPIQGNQNYYETLFARPSVKTTLEQLNIETPYEMMFYYYAKLPEDKSLFISPNRICDDNLFLEYRAPLEMYMNKTLHLEPPQQYLGNIQKYIFPQVPQKDLIQELGKARKKHWPGSWSILLSMIKEIEFLSEKHKVKKLATICKMRLLQKQKKNSQLKKAKLLFEKGNLYQAEIVLEQILEVAPYNQDVHRFLAKVYTHLKDIKNALKHYQYNLKINPLDYMAHNALGNIYYNMKKYKQGKYHFLKAFEANPYYLRGIAQWIVTEITHARKNEAHFAYKKASEILTLKQFDSLTHHIKQLLKQRKE